MIPRSRPRKIEHPREIVSPALGYGQPAPLRPGPMSLCWWTQAEACCRARKQSATSPCV